LRIKAGGNLNAGRRCHSLKAEGVDRLVLGHARASHRNSMEEMMNAEFRAESSTTANAQVVRGPGSWAYIYTVLGFVVTIERTVIGMMVPLSTRTIIREILETAETEAAKLKEAACFGKAANPPTTDFELVRAWLAFLRR
jgi:hypothetical protein